MLLVRRFNQISERSDMLKGKPQESHDSDALGLLYDFALEPQRTDELADQWEYTVRAIRNQVPFGYGRILDDLSIHRHLKRAQSLLRLGRSSSRSAFPELESASFVPAVVVDRQLRILDANDTGKSILKRDGTLPFQLVDQEQVKAAVANVLSPGAPGRSTLRLSAPQSQRTKLIIIEAISSISQTNDVALIAWTDVAWPQGVDARLQATFYLTASEVDIVRSLLEHRSIREVARERQRSVETVRTQLRSIFSKTETNSQLELMQVIMSLMELEAASPSGKVSDGSDFFEVFKSETTEAVQFVKRKTARNRTLCYLINGAKCEHPVLVLTGEWATMRSLPEIELYSRGCGFKMIVPVRPGYGACSNPLNGHEYGYTIIEDAMAAMDAECAGKFSILSFGADSYHAIRLADTHPDRVSAVFSVAGHMPFTRRAQVERMGKWHKFIIAAARYTPHILPLLLEASFAWVRHVGVRHFLETTFLTSPPDLAALRHDDVFEVITRSAPFLLAPANGLADAFARQIRERDQADWHEAALSVSARIPVHFWNGQHDPHLPPETIREFREDFRDAHFKVFTDAGSLLFFSHYTDILNHMKNVMARDTVRAQ